MRPVPSASIIGARRAGKSFHALQAADELIRASHTKSLAQVRLIDFDNPILSTMDVRALNLIQSTFPKIRPELGLKTPIVFLLDEIHRISGWED